MLTGGHTRSSISSNVVAANEVWNNNPIIAADANAVGAFPWSSSSNDSAVVVTVPPDSYGAHIEGGICDAGIALLEIYEKP